MKTLIDITDPEHIIRVKDAIACELVYGIRGKLGGHIRGNYDYCPKWMFKDQEGSKYRGHRLT